MTPIIATAPVLYTTKEVLTILKLQDIRTVTNFITSGKLEARFVGNRWLVAASDLAAFLNNAPTIATKGRRRAANA